MAMIAAESLGVPLDAVSISAHVDTDLTTDTSGTFGSQPDQHRRPRHVRGRPGRAQAAAGLGRPEVHRRRARRRTRQDARRSRRTDIDIEDGFVVDQGATQQAGCRSTQVVQFGGAPILGPLDLHPGSALGAHRLGRARRRGRGRHRHRHGRRHAATWPRTTSGGSFNPFALEQQIEGGVVMALGAALTEELLIDKATGLPLNPNMLDYKPLEHQGRAARTSRSSWSSGPRITASTARTASASRRWARRRRPSRTPSTTPSGSGSTDMPFTREKVLAALKGAEAGGADEKFRAVRADHGRRGGRAAGQVRRHGQGRSAAAATWSPAS